MGIFNFLKKANRSRVKITGNGVSQSNDRLALSKYSGLPRYFMIDGVKYDIDNPLDIVRMPLIENTFYIDGVLYGMDTVLYEHYRKCPDRRIGYIAYDKCQEFRKNGIITKSQWELEVEARFAERAEEIERRKKQCDTFSIDDMQLFPNIPFGFHWVMQLTHTDGVAWFMLNYNNQQIARNYIAQIDKLIVDSHQYIDGIEDAFIDLDKINYGYPNRMRKDSMACTRVECYPYTKTGKLSKYPVVLHFETFPQNHDYGGFSGETIICGEIKILRDGNIGSAWVNIWGNTFRIGLYGLSLVLKRVDNPYGNLFKFSDIIK